MSARIAALLTAIGRLASESERPPWVGNFRPLPLINIPNHVRRQRLFLAISFPDRNHDFGTPQIGRLRRYFRPMERSSGIEEEIGRIELRSAQLVLD